MVLEGPDKIEITEEQLEYLQTTYDDLTLDMEEMIHDFFSPFEIMVNEGIFTGKSANAYKEFCLLVQQYLEIRFGMVLSELEKVANEFKSKLNEVENYVD